MNLLHYILGALAMAYVVLLAALTAWVYITTRNISTAFSINDEHDAREHGGFSEKLFVLLKIISIVRRGVILSGVVVIATELISISIRR